jgi:hypothetical protein
MNPGGRPGPRPAPGLGLWGVVPDGAFGFMVADYYEMLGIPPGADRETIEEALARCRPKWSAGARNPKHRHTFQSYLDQIPNIRAALLGDLAARAGYDAELAAQRRLQLDRKLDELQRLVRLRSAKGGLTVSDRDRLRAEADRLGVPDDAFRGLLEPIPPLPEAPPEPDEPDDPPVDAIDPATRGQIRRTLEHLGRIDLYDALGLSRDAPQSEINGRADEERQRWRQKSKVSAEMTWGPPRPDPGTTGRSTSKPRSASAGRSASASTASGGSARGPDRPCSTRPPASGSSPTAPTG